MLMCVGTDFIPEFIHCHTHTHNAHTIWLTGEGNQSWQVCRRNYCFSFSPPSTLLVCWCDRWQKKVIKAYGSSCIRGTFSSLSCIKISSQFYCSGLIVKRRFAVNICLCIGILGMLIAVWGASVCRWIISLKRSWMLKFWW